MGGGGMHSDNKRLISETMLEALMAQHPVPILGFHVDNGSECINHVVAKLLSNSLVEFTKSRVYQ
jgi:hypothetical protein